MQAAPRRIPSWIAGSFLMLAASLVDATTEAAQVQRFALVIGSNRSPSPDLQPLQYADDDAALWTRLLDSSAEQVILLTELDTESQQRFRELTPRSRLPTSSAVRGALDEVFAAIEQAKRQGAETELFFVYSGHGQRLADGEGALSLNDTVLTRSDLYGLLIERSPATFTHLIIDACHAYFAVHRRGGEPTWRPDRSGRTRDEVFRDYLDLQDLGRYPRVGAVLSTSSEAETHEWQRYRAGVFSHELRSGLLGAADVNRDLRIEYSELQAFVEAANQRVRVPQARLQVSVHAPAAAQARPIVDLRQLHGATLLDIPRSREGRFTVEDRDGNRLLDLHKTSEQAVTVALLGSKQFFVRDLDSQTEARVDARPGPRITLAGLPERSLAARTRGAVDATFRQDLFAQPYGPAYYAGYVAQRPLVAVAMNPVDRVSDDDVVGVSGGPPWALLGGAGALGLGTASLVGAGLVAVLALDRVQRVQEAVLFDGAAQQAGDEAALLGAAAVGLGGLAAALGASGAGLLLSPVLEGLWQDADLDERDTR